MSQPRRRRKQQSSPVKGIIIGVIVVALIVVAAMFLKGGGDETAASDFSPLPVDTYYANSQNLVGNNYSVEGVVDRRERITPDGQIISLRISTPSGDTPIPILIPKAIGSINIEPGFKLKMNVQVNSEGIPEATQVADL